jgi:colicin import membrane protein
MNRHRPHRSRLLVSWLRACAVLAPSLAGAASDAEQAERAAIARERAEIEARYAARESECKTRFVVTSCIEEAKRDRRQSLDVLRARQLALDEAERREKTAARRAELAAQAADDARRDQERAARAASAPPAAAPLPLEPRHERGASAPARSGAPLERPARVGVTIEPGRSHAPTAAERSEREARSRASYETRLRQAEEHRQKVEEETAKRLKDHPAAAPLPTPASVPAR